MKDGGDSYGTREFNWMPNADTAGKIARVLQNGNAVAPKNRRQRRLLKKAARVQVKLPND